MIISLVANKKNEEKKVTKFELTKVQIEKFQIEKFQILFSIILTAGIFTILSIFKTPKKHNNNDKKLVKPTNAEKVMEVKNTILDIAELAKDIKTDLENLKDKLNIKEHKNAHNIEFLEGIIKKLNNVISTANSFPYCIDNDKIYDINDDEVIFDYKKSLLESIVYLATSLKYNLIYDNKNNEEIQKVIDKYNTNELTKMTNKFFKNNKHNNDKKLVEIADFTGEIKVKNILLDIAEFAKDIKTDLENLKDQLNKKEHKSSYNIEFIEEVIRKLNIAIYNANSFPCDINDDKVIFDYKKSLLGLIFSLVLSLECNLIYDNTNNEEIKKVVDKYNTNELTKMTNKFFKNNKQKSLN